MICCSPLRSIHLLRLHRPLFLLALSRSGNSVSIHRVIRGMRIVRAVVDPTPRHIRRLTKVLPQLGFEPHPAQRELLRSLGCQPSVHGVGTSLTHHSPTEAEEPLGVRAGSRGVGSCTIGRPVAVVHVADAAVFPVAAVRGRRWSKKSAVDSELAAVCSIKVIKVMTVAGRIPTSPADTGAPSRLSQREPTPCAA